MAVFYPSPDGIDRLDDISEEDEALPLDHFFINYAAGIGALAFSFYVFTVSMTLIYATKTVDVGKKARKMQLLLLHEKHKDK